MTVKGTGAMANVSYGWSGWRYTGLKITELEIEEGITRIGAMCFYETAVKKAKLANSILSIGDNAFRGWTEYEGALVMPSSLTQLDYRAFERSTFDLDFTPCTQFKELSNGLNVWCGARVIMPASLEKITVNGAFCGSWQEGCCTYVDLSRCTKLTDMGSNVWFDDCKDGEIILPGSFVGLNIPTVNYGGFENCTSKLSIAVPDDKVLYIDGQRMEETDGKADISAWMGQTVEFDWRAGFSVKTGTLTGQEGTLHYYTDFDGSNLGNEIPDGYKVVRETDDVTLYVQAYSDYTVFPEHLKVTATIDGVSQTVEVEELKHNLFRFTLPAGAVKVSAKFSLGGYCGGLGTEGNNARWEITDDNRLVISGEGEVTSSGWHYDKYPWKTVKAVEVCEGITSLPSSAFSTLNSGDYYKPINSGVVVTLPSTLESIGENCFHSSCVTVDMSKCTKLTTIKDQVFLYFAGGDVLLPTTVTTVDVRAFEGAAQFNPHVYYPVADSQVLLANGQQVKSVDGSADIAAAIFSAQGYYVELSLHTGYEVSAAATASGVLKVYADQALTQEIQAGFKAIRENDNTRIYIKVIPNDLKILFKNDLTVKGKSGNIAVTQIDDEVFSFIMPAEPVEATAKFTTGGYCGNTAVNNGHNLIWTLDDGTLAFQQNVMAQGSNTEMSNYASGGTPWQSYSSSVKDIDMGAATSIGDYAFRSCTGVVGMEFGETPMPVGTNAFASQMVLIVPAASYSEFQSQWAEYSSNIFRDKETLTMTDGQQWRTYYSKVGRILPSGLKAYTVTGISSSEAEVSQALDYIPAGQAVLIENSAKTACTAEAVTSLETCLMTTDENNLLQWLTAPKDVTVGEGYTLYKDEFVMVSSGMLPAGIAFLPTESSSAARRLTISGGMGEATDIDKVSTDTEETEATWYSLDGKKLSGKPAGKGVYLRNGKKVVIK